ncbi:MAG TPA: DUF2938 domain-containing protein [Gemmatimonadaceae bacterium]|nr:DUF2938 domain-containing protein [Gemmatimonadaceae bacterium]
MPAQFAMHAILVGVGATVVIDLWALFLKRVLGISSLSYCLLGRWILHMPSGTFMHRGIATADAKRHECAVGWAAHYSIGIAFALTFVLLAGSSWLAAPRLLPALAFGVVTVIVPYFTLQPAFGLGIAASRTPSPKRARVKSLLTHAWFGIGLYLSALLLHQFG